MKTFERLVLKYILRIIYYVSYIIPVKKRVVFATYRKDSIEGNFKYIYDKSSLKFERIVFFEINKLFMNILKIIMGIKNPIIIPKVELNITDILVVSIVWVLVLYAISIKDDNVNAIEIIHPK